MQRYPSLRNSNIDSSVRPIRTMKFISIVMLFATKLRMIILTCTITTPVKKKKYKCNINSYNVYYRLINY